MRRKVARLRSLDGAQWNVLCASLALLPTIQIGLRLVGFKRTTRLLAARSARPPNALSADRARAVSEVVGLVAGQSVIGARCLSRSLVLWFLLRRRGIDAELMIGAEMPRGGSLSAHAWVELAGEPINDAPDVRERFGSFDLQLPRLVEAPRQ